VSDFANPAEIGGNALPSSEQKDRALSTWEQDAHQLLTASNEGMPGSEAPPSCGSAGR
jgi:hypothetical protein